MSTKNNSKEHAAPATQATLDTINKNAVDDKDKERTKVRWELDAALLTATWPDNSTAQFDLALLFENFVDLTNPQKLATANGVHQKLGDACARPKSEKLTPVNARIVMADTFKAICDGTAWTRKGGGSGGIGLAKQIEQAAAKLTLEERQQMNEMFQKMGLSKRI